MQPHNASAHYKKWFKLDQVLNFKTFTIGRNTISHYVQKINEKMWDLTQKNPPLTKGLQSEKTNITIVAERDGGSVNPFTAPGPLFVCNFLCWNFKKCKISFCWGQYWFLGSNKRVRTMEVRYLLDSNEGITLWHRYCKLTVVKLINCCQFWNGPFSESHKKNCT